jgi:hypothetical protein
MRESSFAGKLKRETSRISKNSMKRTTSQMTSERQSFSAEMFQDDLQEQ